MFPGSRRSGRDRVLPTSPRDRGRARGMRTPCPTTPHPRRRLSFRRHEVDRDGHALEPKALAKLVLDPVPVVARDQPAIVHEDAETGWPRAHLRPVQDVEPAPAAAAADALPGAPAARGSAPPSRSGLRIGRNIQPRRCRAAARGPCPSWRTRRGSEAAGAAASRGAAARPPIRTSPASHLERTTTVAHCALRAVPRRTGPGTPRLRSRPRAPARRRHVPRASSARSSE